MIELTDNQIRALAVEYAAQYQHTKTGERGPGLDTLRAAIEMTSPEETTRAVTAMRAALRTLGPINIHKPAMTSIPAEYGWVVIQAVRYAIGRSTYVVNRTVDMVIDEWDSLTPQTRQVIAQDVHEAIETASRLGRTLGMQMDHDDWAGLRAWIQKKEENQ